MSDRHYDIIGDIHGHGDQLIALLEKLGYRWAGGYYRHPERIAIFLGDFIDRGPQQRSVLQTVMPMVKEGTALAVMGNHEFNALAYHTEHPERAGTWLRPRDNKNTNQHLAFLNEYLGASREEELREVLEFFYSLPLWLELDGLRVVHACWAPHHIDALKPSLSNSNTLSPVLLAEASRENSVAYNAVETLLKGVELPLPAHRFFFDKDGHKRELVRTQWWRTQADTYGDIALPFGILDAETAVIPIRRDRLLGYPIDEKPVFFGHYWMKGEPAPLAGNVACLDYSVAKDGKLVAYRWQGEQTLTADNFVYC